MDPVRKSRKNQIRVLERQIRVILHAWNPIGFPMPPDEYDCLVHRVLSSLLRGESREQLRELITRELTEHFGLPDRVGDVSMVVEQIVNLPHSGKPHGTG